MLDVAHMNTRTARQYIAQRTGVLVDFARGRRGIVRLDVGEIRAGYSRCNKYYRHRGVERASKLTRCWGILWFGRSIGIHVRHVSLDVSNIAILVKEQQRGWSKWKKRTKYYSTATHASGAQYFIFKYFRVGGKHSSFGEKKYATALH
jgi:hypothetical protein